MTNFYLVRHGQKEQISGEAPLSELGIKQAMLTAKYFTDKNIDLLYASPLLRARQTAEYIAKELHLPVHFDDRLKERLNWGDNPDESFEEFIEEWNKTIENRTYIPKYGDSSINAGNKIESVLDELKNTDKNIVFVTHGGIIIDLLRNWYKDDYLKTIKIELPTGEVSECSITHLIFKGNKFKVEEVGFMGHLILPLMLK